MRSTTERTRPADAAARSERPGRAARPKDPAFVIELVGAPGAGKTTLLPAVMDSCRAAGLSPYTVVDAARAYSARTASGRVVSLLPGRARRRALWGLFVIHRALSGIRFAAARPALTRYVLASQRGRSAGAQARERRVLHWYGRLMGAYAFLTRRARQGEVLVLDEGFVHRAVQLHASGVEIPDRARIQAYAALIPRPDLLVHVRAPADECERRIRARGVWTRFDGQDTDELSRFVSSAHLATELVADAARASGWAVVDVDNGGHAGSEAELADRYTAALCRWLPQAAP